MRDKELLLHTNKKVEQNHATHTTRVFGVRVGRQVELKFDFTPKLRVR